MHSMLHSVAGFEELLTATAAQSPYDFRSIFQPEGKLSKRREKKRLALLRALDDRITSVLEEGEVVRMVSHGLENSIVEQLFFGWAAYYMNLTAFVLTDRRLLTFQISSRQKPKTFIRQFRLGSIRSVKKGWAGPLKVTTSDDKTMAFAKLPGKDAQRLANLLNAAGEEDSTQWVKHGRENLCPNCFQPVEGLPLQCGLCGQPFKSPRRAALLSFLFPGLGDFYLGHYGFAVMEMLVATALWTSLLLSLTDTAAADALPLAAAFLATAMLLVPFIHLPDSVMTWFIARKGLTPAGSPPVGFSGTNMSGQ